MSIEKIDEISGAAGIVDIPTGWKPPEKELARENVEEYFVLMITYEYLFALMNDLPDDIKRDPEALRQYPIFSDRERLQRQVSLRMDEIHEALKTKNKFLYPGGSVYMDFKIMKQMALEKMGREEGVANKRKAITRGRQMLKARFSLNMSVDEAIGVAREFVASWDWGEGGGEQE